VVALEAEARIPIGMIYHDPTAEPGTFPNPATADIDPVTNADTYTNIVNRYRI